MKKPATRAVHRDEYTIAPNTTATFKAVGALDIVVE
jgi:hypothetical protein